jgi:Skp family chaperone for outer membrane proteins
MRAVLLLCVLASLAGNAAAAETKPAPTTPRIAVLRLDEAIRNSKLYSTRLEALRKEKTDAESQLKQMDEQLQQLDNGLQGLNPTNDRYAKMSEDFEVLKLKRKMVADRARGDLDRRHAQLLKQTYDSLRGQLKDYARDNGIGLVELVPNAELQAASSTDVQLQLGLQSVLYYDPALDITEAFIGYANGRFAAEAVSGPLLPPLADPKAAPQPAGTPGQPAGK